MRVAYVNLSDGRINFVLAPDYHAAALTPFDGMGMVIVDSHPEVSGLSSEEIVGNYLFDLKSDTFIPAPPEEVGDE